MGWREDSAHIKAQRAHLIDMIGMQDEGECLECRAKRIVHLLVFGAAMSVVALAAYRIGKLRNTP